MEVAVKNEVLEKEIVKTLKTVYDPEIPVNIWDLGLIYNVDVDEDNNVEVRMTLTAPNCPMADSIIYEMDQKLKKLEGTNKVTIDLTFDPPWYPDLMSEEAKLELGFL